MIPVASAGAQVLHLDAVGQALSRGHRVGGGALGYREVRLCAGQDQGACRGWAVGIGRGEEGLVVDDPPGGVIDPVEDRRLDVGVYRGAPPVVLGVEGGPRRPIGARVVEGVGREVVEDVVLDQSSVGADNLDQASLRPGLHRILGDGVVLKGVTLIRA